MFLADTSLDFENVISFVLYDAFLARIFHLYCKSVGNFQSWLLVPVVEPFSFYAFKVTVSVSAAT